MVCCLSAGDRKYDLITSVGRVASVQDGREAAVWTPELVKIEQTVRSVHIAQNLLCDLRPAGVRCLCEPGEREPWKSEEGERETRRSSGKEHTQRENRVWLPGNIGIHLRLITLPLKQKAWVCFACVV